jgi:S-adenosylmethionine:diacylglycerol 3-amino-3-carboxypropyl transferase
MLKAIFTSDIAYSVQNEDYQTELAVLEYLFSGRLLRVLMVASSGENVLSMLTQGMVAGVDAVDLNPAQIHLCELRRAALEQLPRDEQLRLFGAHTAYRGEAEPSERQALYELVAPALPEASRAYWDTRGAADLAAGVQHVGRNDQLMRAICAALRAAGFAPLEQPLLDEQLPAWISVYQQVMTAEHIREAFGIQAEALAQKIAGIAGRLGECHFRAVQHPGAAYNPFVTTVFAGAYAAIAGDLGYPLYLQEAGQAALRRLGTRERLSLHTGNLLGRMQTLAAEHGAYDLISISNIPDWMSAEQVEDMARQASACLNSGGALLARTASGNPVVSSAMSRHLRTDPEFDQELLNAERGPWFRSIAVGFK